jgi:hypothetical protein
MSLKRFGTDYGGYYYPADLGGLDKSSIIYCVGAGEDISHDIELAGKTGAPIHIFDPTERSLEHVRLVNTALNINQAPPSNPRYGGGDSTYWSRILGAGAQSSQIQFHPYGLYTCDNPDMRFYKPTNPEYVSHSLVPGMKSQDYVSVAVKSLNTIMAELGHTRIDLLKIDIEGCECDVLEKMVMDGIFPRFLAVDFDLGWTGEKIRDRQRCLDIIELLQQNRYRILHRKESDISFERIQ